MSNLKKKSPSLIETARAAFASLIMTVGGLKMVKRAVDLHKAGPDNKMDGTVSAIQYVVVGDNNMVDSIRNYSMTVYFSDEAPRDRRNTRTNKQGWTKEVEAGQWQSQLAFAASQRDNRCVVAVPTITKNGEIGNMSTIMHDVEVNSLEEFAAFVKQHSAKTVQGVVRNTRRETLAINDQQSQINELGCIDFKMLAEGQAQQTAILADLAAAIADIRKAG